jgi:MoaA/NifB/PqqE/SkfB family radical SAM enzyme
MINPPKFQNYLELENSSWQKNFEEQWKNNQWPVECHRCQLVEATGANSVRVYELEKYKNNLGDYFTVGGVLDNVCNSACQFCSAELSTKIGSLESKKFIRINNYPSLKTLPWEKITHLDINGGEPSSSPNYRNLLNSLPPNLKAIRINTNASKYINQIDELESKNIQVTITISLDGTDLVHEYVRWPGKWKTFCKVVDQYKKSAAVVNFWTTVNALNVGDFDNIVNYTQSVDLDHSWAFLSDPDELNVRYTNSFTVSAKEKIKNQQIISNLAIGSDNQIEIDRFISRQDAVRKISIKDFL